MNNYFKLAFEYLKGFIFGFTLSLMCFRFFSYNSFEIKFIITSTFLCISGILANNFLEYKFKRLYNIYKYLSLVIIAIFIIMEINKLNYFFIGTFLYNACEEILKVYKTKKNTFIRFLFVILGLLLEILFF